MFDGTKNIPPLSNFSAMTKTQLQLVFMLLYEDYFLIVIGGLRVPFPHL